VIGPGTNHHHIADVADIIEGLRLCASVKGVEGRTYILAGRESVPLNTLIDIIAAEVGAPGVRGHWPAAPLHVYRALDRIAVAWLGRKLPRADRLAIFLGDRTFDVSRARHELGYSPRIPLRDTVGRLAEWFRSQGHLPS
jgi:nucleoside-diphosphate-sugar epimerase